MSSSRTSRIGAVRKACQETDTANCLTTSHAGVRLRLWRASARIGRVGSEHLAKQNLHEKRAMTCGERMQYNIADGTVETEFSVVPKNKTVVKHKACKLSLGMEPVQQNHGTKHKRYRLTLGMGQMQQDDGAKHKSLVHKNHRGLGRFYWVLRACSQHAKTTGRRGKTVGVS
ncbi:hypothetical protein ZIOFF_015030 [Zingiber officinale]|uniref:Uncharacterized protein n=1 Tax=Zingiber officinale TaxID=94328 RepID=A0A8J5HXU4_ZINOF|nr:hypothetical protein ZIOFF_015030 [Zingiber officinale]